MSQAKMKSVESTTEVEMEYHQMVALSPINTMTATKDGTLTYLNDVSIKTLKTLQEHINVNVDDLIGESIDMFHSNPAVQRKIIGDPKNLPYHTVIDFAGEKLDLQLKVKDINAIPTSDYPTPAKRPLNSRLLTGKLENKFNIVMPDWKSELELCLEELRCKQ